MSKKPKRPLTAKQAAFVDEYLIDLNATQAAIRAGYSPKSAKLIGCQNITKLNIAEAIAKAKAERSERVKIDQDQVLKEWGKLAFLDPRRLFDKDGWLINIPDLDADVAAAITGFDVTRSFNKENGTFDTLMKIKFSDKKGALDSVAKHLGMFIERIQHGFDEPTVRAILAGFPKEYADRVIAELGKISTNVARITR